MYDYNRDYYSHTYLFTPEKRAVSLWSQPMGKTEFSSTTQNPTLSGALTCFNILISLLKPSKSIKSLFKYFSAKMLNVVKFNNWLLHSWECSIWSCTIDGHMTFNFQICDHSIICFQNKNTGFWKLLVVFGLAALWDSISVNIGPSARERERKRSERTGE